MDKCHEKKYIQVNGVCCLSNPQRPKNCLTHSWLYHVPPDMGTKPEVTKPKLWLDHEAEAEAEALAFWNHEAEAEAEALPFLNHEAEAESEAQVFDHRFLAHKKYAPSKEYYYTQCDNEHDE